VAVILEVKAGPMAGKKISVQKGQTLSIGRTDKANVAIPHDDKMSRLHFTIECGPAGVRVIDRDSANGLYINGARVKDSIVVNQDEIRAGDTFFIVRIVPDEAPAVGPASQVPAVPPAAHPADVTAKTPAAPPKVAPAPAPPPAVSSPPPPPAAVPTRAPEPPRPAPPPPPSPAPKPAPPPAAPPPAAKPAAPAPAPAAVAVEPGGPVRIGSWKFTRIPKGWEVQEAYGITYAGKDAFPSSVVATEELLYSGSSLQQYVEAQVNMLRQYLREPRIEPAVPPKIAGCEDSLAIEVSYTTKEKHNIFYRRIYAKVGGRVAVLTLTTLENELARCQPAFNEILSGVSLEPQPSES
jgi:predicted component of type VI protein secretion system